MATPIIKEKRRKLLALIVENSEVFELLTEKDLDKAIRNRNRTMAGILSSLQSTDSISTRIHRPVDQIPRILKLVRGAEELSLDSTRGTESLAHSIDLFSEGINLNEYKPNTISPPLSNINVEINEIIKTDGFSSIFYSFGLDLDKLCLSEGQIIHFVENYRKWLPRGVGSTLFLLKGENSFFVAGVYMYERGSLKLIIYPFAYKRLWLAENKHLIVVPYRKNTRA